MASPASGPNRGKPDMKIQPMPRKPVKKIVNSPDDKIIRRMPITEGQLKQIKRYYGIK